MPFKLLNRVARAVALLAFISCVSLVVLMIMLPVSLPASGIRVAGTPEQLERGDYLFNNVLGCPVCHSERDWSRFGGPPLPPLGGGRPCDAAGALPMGLAGNKGFPGTICFRNITSDDATGVGSWTDGELIRAIREGVDRDGNTLFPIMPYFLYSRLADDDVEAVVAYLRTLPPVVRPLPDTDLDFPVNIFIGFLPQPVREPVAAVDESDAVAYGEYLAHVARCGFCHSPRNQRSRLPFEGREYSGGVEFRGRKGVFYSSNLTPDPSGLGGMDQAEFIALFRRPEGPAREEIDIMPWTYYAGMSDEDLAAIYAYLRSLPARPFGGMPN